MKFRTLRLKINMGLIKTVFCCSDISMESSRPTVKKLTIFGKRLKGSAAKDWVDRADVRILDNSKHKIKFPF